MKIYISLLMSIVFLTACQSNKKSEVENQSNIHKIVVQEVIQVGEYTYLRALENGVEKWLAAPSFQAEIGTTYYFKNGMEMPDFESKELKRTFKSIYFVEGVSKDPNAANTTNVPEKVTLDNVDLNSVDLSQKATKPILEKEDVKIKATKGVITIAKLYKNMKAYENKTIKVKGKVTKFNPAIMNKNWIHIQDGSEHNGEFDLTIITNTEVKVGDVIIVEGKVLLNKDFGAGYFYKLIIEGAVLAQ